MVKGKSVLLFTIDHLLESESHAELYLARGGRGRADAAERRERRLAVHAREDEQARDGEVRAVEKIESLHAELEARRVAEAREAYALERGQIEGAQVRADERAAGL